VGILSGRAFARIATGVAGSGLVCIGLLVTGGGVVVTSQAADRLNVCHAGSLQSVFAAVENTFKAQHPGVVVNDVSGGSVALAGRLAAGLQPCDVYAAADYLDVDLLLKPLGLADYTIVFARGRMVLAYVETDPKTQGIAGPGDFKPPASIPQAVPDWYKLLLAPGVRISSSHPFLDPGGYRSHMIFQLAEAYYNVPGLSNMLLEHVTVNAAVGAPSASAPTLGRDFNFQFSYEHSAAAAARSNPAYRYVAIPDRIDLSNAANDSYYARASVTMPGIGPTGTDARATIPAARVAWGLTILKNSPNHEHASVFVNMLLGPVGTAAFDANGPTAITPAFVSIGDYARLPESLKRFVTTGAAP
jgi:ABC-type molybdate transport system substrate-binding protein